MFYGFYCVSSKVSIFLWVLAGFPPVLEAPPVVKQAQETGFGHAILVPKTRPKTDQKAASDAVIILNRPFHLLLIGRYNRIPL